MPAFQVVHTKHEKSVQSKMQPNGSIPHIIMQPFGIIGQEGIYMIWPRIEALRIDHDLTQSDVAKILNCQREVYRRYEKGVRELPLSYAIILADYYDVSLDYLVGRKHSKDPYNS